MNVCLCVCSSLCVGEVEGNTLYKANTGKGGKSKRFLISQKKQVRAATHSPGSCRKLERLSHQDISQQPGEYSAGNMKPNPFLSSPQCECVGVCKRDHIVSCSYDYVHGSYCTHVEQGSADNVCSSSNTYHDNEAAK